MRGVEVVAIALGTASLAAAALGVRGSVERHPDVGHEVRTAEWTPGPSVAVHQVADQSARVLEAAHSMEPLACALALRGFDRGFWGGSEHVRVHRPGDPGPADRDAYVWATTERLGPASVPPLRDALSSPSSCVQRTAAALLGRMEDDLVEGAVRDALGAATEAERIGGALAAGYGDLHGVVSTLERTLSSGSLEVRLAALWALGRIEERSSVPAVLTLLDDPDTRIRQNALWALGQMESADAVDGVSDHLADPDPAVRVNAAWALGRIEHPDAIPPLISRLDVDEDPTVRRMIAWALGQIE